jgi:hypothetical protein
MKSNVTLKGNFLCILRDVHGREISRIEDHNLVVNNGRDNVLKLLGGDVAGLPITKIGAGTGTAAANVSDTGLTAGVLKTVSTVTYGTGTVTFKATFGTGDANGLALSEFGLFNSGSVLFARKVNSSVINKNNTFSFDVEWTIQVVNL